MRFYPRRFSVRQAIVGPIHIVRFCCTVGSLPFVHGLSIWAGRTRTPAACVLWSKAFTLRRRVAAMPIPAGDACLDVRALEEAGYERAEARAVLQARYPELASRRRGQLLSSVYGPSYSRSARRGSLHGGVLWVRQGPPELRTAEDAQAELAAAQAAERALLRQPAPARATAAAAEPAGVAKVAVAACAASEAPPRTGPCPAAPRTPTPPRGVLTWGVDGQRLTPKTVRPARVSFAAQPHTTRRGVHPYQLPFRRVCWWPAEAVTEARAEALYECWGVAPKAE